MNAESGDVELVPDQRGPITRPARRVGQPSHPLEPSRRIDTYRDGGKSLFVILCAYAFAIPLENFSPVLGRSISFYLGVTAIFLFLAVRQPRSVPSRLWRGWRVWILILGWATFSLGASSILWSLAPSAGFLEFTSLTGLALVTIAIASLPPRRALVLVWFYVSGISTAALLALVTPASAQYGGRTGSLELDLNQQAFYTVVGIAAIVFLGGRSSTSRKAMLTFLPILLLLVYTVLRTGSRTGVIAMISLVGALFILAIMEKRSSRRIGLTFLAVGGVAMAWVAYEWRFAFIPTRVWEIEQKIIEGTDRQYFWQRALADSDSWIWFGVGLGSEQTYLSEQLGINQVLHNTFLSVAVQGGLLLSVLALLLLILLFRASLESPFRRLLALAIAPVILFAFTLNLTTSKLIWLLVGLALVSMTRPYLPEATDYSKGTVAKL